MPYELRVTTSFGRAFKKLPKQVQQFIRANIFILEDQPLLGEPLKGELHFLRSFHLKLNNTHYRVVYRADEKLQAIDLHYVGTRENFYAEVRRLGVKQVN